MSDHPTPEFYVAHVNGKPVLGIRPATPEDFRKAGWVKVEDAQRALDAILDALRIPAVIDLAAALSGEEANSDLLDNPQIEAMYGMVYECQAHQMHGMVCDCQKRADNPALSGEEDQ